MRVQFGVVILAIGVLAACAADRTGTGDGASGAKPVGSAIDTHQMPALASVPAGYYAATRNGETVYCRKEVETGTILARVKCRSAAQLAADEQAAQELRDIHGRGADGSRTTLK